MKTLIFILPFLYLSCSNDTKSKRKLVPPDKNAIQSNDTFKISCNKPNIESLIVYNDTSYDYPNYSGHTIKSFDKKRRLIQVFKGNLFESNSKNFNSSTIIYDTTGHIIYEDKTKELIRWHCYCYKFDLKGHLISKEGYSSGEIGMKAYYIYDDDKLVKEIIERSGEKSEIVH